MSGIHEAVLWEDSQPFSNNSLSELGTLHSYQLRNLLFLCLLQVFLFLTVVFVPQQLDGDIAFPLFKFWWVVGHGSIELLWTPSVGWAHRHIDFPHHFSEIRLCFPILWALEDISKTQAHLRCLPPRYPNPSSEWVQRNPRLIVVPSLQFLDHTWTLQGINLRLFFHLLWKEQFSE